MSAAKPMRPGARYLLYMRAWAESESGGPARLTPAQRRRVIRKSRRWRKQRRNLP